MNPVAQLLLGEWRYTANGTLVAAHGCVTLKGCAILSLVGASANLIVAGFAERHGQPIRFLPFMLVAFPLMLMSILVSSFYVYLRYF